MSEKTTNFINTIGVLARNEFLSRDRWVLPSVCIAQAALESGWNLNAKTLFGIKGKGFTATTSEYYDGHYVQNQDSFRSYPNAASAVVGYYDFITGTPRYAGVVNNADYRDAVDKLIHTTDGAPYATSPTYINNVISIIEQYNLTKWDVRDTKPNTLNNGSTAHNVGERVNYHTIYASSDSEQALSPLYKEGTITRIVAGARNPYLLDDGTGWINDACIEESNTPLVSEDISVGDKVRVLNNETYTGGSFRIYYDEYDVIEVKGDRVVIGIGDVVTCAINKCNIERV